MQIILGQLPRSRKRLRERTGSTGTDTLSIVALLQETVDTTDWELETSLGRSRLLGLVGIDARRLSGLGLSANFARHFRDEVVCSVEWCWLKRKEECGRRIRRGGTEGGLRTL